MILGSVSAAWTLDFTFVELLTSDTQNPKSLLYSPNAEPEP